MLATFLKYRFTLDAVSQLDRDIPTALATIREWKNSFVPINRVPSEVLSLIPTPSSQGLIFRKFSTPPLAQSLHSACRVVVTIRPDDRKEQLLCENAARAGERVRPSGAC